MNLAWQVRAGIAGVAMILAVAAGPALAATTLTYSPGTAAPGTTVTIENACLGVTDRPPARIAAAFVNVTSEVSPLTFKRQAVARAVARSTEYAVVIPDLAPGSYQIVLECLPGDWRTNTAEGGSEPLRLALAQFPDNPLQRLMGGLLIIWTR